MKNGIIESSKEEFKPETALIVYKTGGEDFYIEMHRIDRSGRMLEGVPLSEKCMAGIADAFSAVQGGQPHGIIPANMLFCDIRAGRQKYIWHNPPRRRMMFFREDLKIENGEYHMPGIVYAAAGSALYVYAYKDKKLTGSSELFRAPFFNVNSAGAVCLGNAEVEYPDSQEFGKIIEYWEKKFWMSEFSHLSDGNPTKENLVLVTKRSVDKFDGGMLTGINKRLKQLMA